jgi:restriction endonuclease S subunit
MSNPKLNFNKSDWTPVKFGDVAIQQKKSVDRENTHLTRYVTGAHMSSEDLHLRDWGNLEDEYLGPAFIRYFEEGDILYGSRRTYLRKVTIAPFEGITANTTFVVKANEDLIDKRLLPFVMLSEEFSQHSIQNSKGSVNPYINWKDIANYEFLLPPKEQQAEIAELLWAMDDVVEKKSKCIEEIDILIAASLKEQYLDSHENLTTLGGAGKWLSGGTPSKQNALFWNGDIPWVSPKDMKVDFVETSIDKITQLAVDNGATLLPEKSLLVVVRGMILAHSFPVALNMVPVAFNQDMRALLVSDDFVPEYLLYYLKFKKDKVLSITTTTTHGTRRLASEELFSVLVPKPTLKAQQDFVDEIEIQTHTLEMLIASVESSKSLQKSLINQVF